MLLDLPSSSRRHKISLTPLIDVVFILLLFFMLSSSFMHLRQIDVSATTESNQLDDAKATLIVKLIGDDGVFQVDAQSFSAQNELQMQQLVQDHDNTVFIIDAADGLKTQTLISVLDAFKVAGAESVTLAGIN